MILRAKELEIDCKSISRPEMSIPDFKWQTINIELNKILGNTERSKINNLKEFFIDIKNDHIKIVPKTISINFSSIDIEPLYCEIIY